MIQQDIVQCSNGMWLGKKSVKMYLLYTHKILHYISKLNFVAHGVKFGVFGTYLHLWVEGDIGPAIS